MFKSCAHQQAGPRSFRKRLLQRVRMTGLFAAAATVLSPFLATPSLATAQPANPNIVLVMADDQGWGDMAYNGHPTLHTPNFDAAAAAGLRFDRFYAAAPVCSPTRALV